MTRLNQLQQRRCVSELGETLIVRVVEGVKTLVDPCDESTAVHVPTGRRARLVDFHFHNQDSALGRHPLTVVFSVGDAVGFAAVSCAGCTVMLNDLPNGQKVDVLPCAQAAAAYATVY